MAAVTPRPPTGIVRSLVGGCFILSFREKNQILPSNIADLFTPLSLAYWIVDDGCFNKISQRVILCTHSFSLDEVNLG